MLRAAADVVDLPGNGVNTGERQFVEIDQVVNVEHIPHLLAIAIDDNRAAGLSGNHEMRRPALILHTELAWAIDRRLPKHHRGQAVDAVVIAHVLIAGALRTAIGRIEVQRVGFGHPVGQIAVAVAGFFFDDRQVAHAAIHLIGRGVEHRRAGGGAPGGFEHVEGAQGIDLKIGARIEHRGGNGDLAGQVNNRLGVGGGEHHGAGVAHIAADKIQRTGRIIGEAFEPVEVVGRTGPRKVVEYRHAVPPHQQAVGQVASYEPGAAGD